MFFLTLLAVVVVKTDRNFIVALDSDKSINWTIIEKLSWTGVSLRWADIASPGTGDMNTSRCGSSGPESLPPQCPTSQLLLKTRIKFYNGAHLRFDSGTAHFNGKWKLFYGNLIMGERG